MNWLKLAATLQIYCFAGLRPIQRFFAPECHSNSGIGSAAAPGSDDDRVRDNAAR